MLDIYKDEVHWSTVLEPVRSASALGFLHSEWTNVGWLNPPRSWTLEDEGFHWPKGWLIGSKMKGGWSSTLYVFFFLHRSWNEGCVHRKWRIGPSKRVSWHTERVVIDPPGLPCEFWVAYFLGKLMWELMGWISMDFQQFLFFWLWAMETCQIIHSSVTSNVDSHCRVTDRVNSENSREHTAREHIHKVKIFNVFAQRVRGKGVFAEKNLLDKSCSVHGSCLRTFQNGNHDPVLGQVWPVCKSWCLAQINKWTMWGVPFFWTHTSVGHGIKRAKRVFPDRTWTMNPQCDARPCWSNIKIRQTYCGCFVGNTMSQMPAFAWLFCIIVVSFSAQKPRFCWEEQSSDQWPTPCLLVYLIISFSFLCGHCEQPWQAQDILCFGLSSVPLLWA